MRFAFVCQCLTLSASIYHCMSISLSVCISFCLSCSLSVFLSVCLTLDLCLNSWILLPYDICFFLSMSHCLSVCVTVCLSICLSILLSVYLSICLFVCLNSWILHDVRCIMSLVAKIGFNVMENSIMFIYIIVWVIEQDSKLYVIDATHFILHKMATATFTQPRKKIKGVDPPKK